MCTHRVIMCIVIWNYMTVHEYVILIREKEVRRMTKRKNSICEISDEGTRSWSRLI